MSVVEIVGQLASAVAFVGIIAAAFVVLNVNLIIGMAAGFMGYAIFNVRSAYISRKRLQRMNIKIR